MKRACIALLLLTVACTKLPVPQNVPFTFADQGWTDAERQQFYHESQGTRLLPYKWFLALEQPDNSQLLRDPEYMARFRFLPDANPQWNPDLLPVGFTKTKDLSGNEWVGLTCAGCHTAQINYHGQGYRIDGGPGLQHVNRFFQYMGLSLGATLLDLSKFDRFAKRVLGANDNLETSLQLRDAVTKFANSMIATAMTAQRLRLFPVADGYGRLDALGGGSNLILPQLAPGDVNYAPADGNVSYPHLWIAPRYDWVEWNRSIAQPMTRNMAEALGVNADLVLQPVGVLPQFSSSVSVNSLFWIEQQIEKLQPPKWPESLFGPIDRALAERGRLIYEAKCASCHAMTEMVEENGHKFIKTRVYQFDEIGTDPIDATNFNKRRVDASSLGWGTNVPVHEIVNKLATSVSKLQYNQMNLTPEERLRMDGYRASLLEAPLGYGTRRLDGAWATAPYLHNGSVPNLYELLLPAAKRSKTFYTANRDFDPKHLGYQSHRMAGATKFDTSLQGNSNSGHEFSNTSGPGVLGPELSEAERWAIIEYMKTK